MIGATIEWYDFFLYGVVAGIVLNKLYFPAEDPLVSTLLAYSTFAVGFVTRPLGGVIFGHFGDRIGRTRVDAWGSLLTGFSAFPAFWILLNGGGSTGAVWLAPIVPFGILYASVYGPEAALFSELFPARMRYTGISFVYQFSGIFASGLTPIVATALPQYSGGDKPWLICAYCALAGLISAGSAIWIGRAERQASNGQIVQQPVERWSPEDQARRTFHKTEHM